MKKEELIILLILLAIVVVLLRLTGRRKKDTTRAGRLMKKYGHMTREKLLSAPEGELVDAVVCRVLAKAEESRRPDPVRTLAELQHGSTVVYTVWAVCKEMARGDLPHCATAPHGSWPTAPPRISAASGRQPAAMPGRH